MESFLDAIAEHWVPHDGQRAFLLAPERYRVLACGRRWGKTDACAVSVLAACESGRGGASPPTRQLLLAPTQTQAEILFERVVELAEQIFPHLPMRIKRTPHASLALGDHRIWARSGHVPRSLRGQGATHVVVDEAAFVQPELITDVALPMLATSHGRLTLLSTPWGRNHFWRFFQRGVDGEAEFWSRQAPSAESPWVSPEFLAIQKQLVSERAFKVEYEAEFLDSSHQVFRSEAIEACTVARLDRRAAAPVCIGVDWARYSDYTAVVAIGGNRDRATLLEIDRFHALPWAAQVARVADWVRRFPGASVLCDATGVGDPVLEMLQRALPDHRVEGVTFTSVRKQELIEGLAMLIERRALRMLPHLDLLRELQHFEAHLQPSGRTHLSAPSGYHDDLVIALALAARDLPAPYHAVIATGGLRTFSHDQVQPLSTEKATSHRADRGATHSGGSSGARTPGGREHASTERLHRDGRRCDDPDRAHHQEDGGVGGGVPH